MKKVSVIFPFFLLFIDTLLTAVSVLWPFFVCSAKYFILVLRSESRERHETFPLSTLQKNVNKTMSNIRNIFFGEKS